MNIAPRRNSGVEDLALIYIAVLTTQGVSRSVVERSFTCLLRRYEEPHRKYHTTAHLTQCMIDFGRAMPSMKQPDIILAAIFYHDIIYDPRRLDNEEKSAKYWNFIARQILGIKDHNFVGEVTRLINLTKGHHTDPISDQDAALFLDIDMSILGAEPAMYDSYAQAVRSEYGHYGDVQWAELRVKKFIEPQLLRDRIFLTDDFAHKYEYQARVNLANERIWYRNV